ncbi:MAG TPA: lysylphosphatidylglycerol synthase domain-containing protein [Kofleriaceae bacterium]|nr:lysylphosphatidylglycerol synthase domain-containing protein [Kofleriaceae bacterium]
MTERAEDVAVDVPAPDRWKWVRRLAPWAISAAALAAILVRYPLARIVAEVERGDVPAMVPAAVAGVLALWLSATIGDLVLLRHLVGRVRFWDLFRGKAGVAVLNALGLAANYGGHALWIQRRFGCAPGTAVGLLLMVSLADLVSVSLVGTVAVWLAGDGLAADARDRLRLIAPAVAALALAVLLLSGSRTSRPLFAPWRDIPRGARLISVAARCGNIAILVVSTWAAARGFGLPVPFVAVATYLPILLVVGAMPINVAGFGPIQAAWVAVFSPWASGEQILAFQFLWHLLFFIGLFVRGAPFLRAVVADVAAGRAASTTSRSGSP